MRLVVLSTLGMLLLAGCASPSPPSSASADGAAWSFTATDGTTYTDRSESNATVLFFMATWCGTCRSKAPVLAQAYEESEASNASVRFLSIDFDPSETPGDLAAWQERYDHPWPHGLDTGRSVQRALDVTVQSTVLVLDADGNVVERFGYGKVTEEGLGAAIERALAAQ